MIKQTAFFLLITLVISGCTSSSVIDLKHLYFSRIVYHDDTGKLDIRGDYREKDWGLDKVQAAVYGNRIELSAARKSGASGKISCRITVLPDVDEVRFCGKTVWRRPESLQVKDGENVKSTAVAGEEQKNIAVPEKKETVRHLKIGSERFFTLKPENMTFKEIFWGREEAHSPVEGSVKKLGDGKSLPQLSGQMLNEYPELEILEIKGNVWDVADLTGLSLPKLKKLVIDSVEVTGLNSVDLPELEEFYLNDRRSVPLGKIALPEKMGNLHTVGIQAFSGNFDFDSLAGKPVKNLRIHGDCRRFDFLKDLPLENLHLSGFVADDGALELLRGLPLRTLSLHPHRTMNDWGFLSGLTRLEFLDISCRGGSGFSPRLLSGLPLKILRFKGNGFDYGEAWMSCRKLPLEELILRNTAVPEKLLLELPLRRLALYEYCSWHIAEPVVLFNRLPELRHLVVMDCILSGGNREIIDRRMNWKIFRNRQLESLSFSGGNIDFVRNLPELSRLAVRNSGKQTISPAALAGRTMEVLIFPDMPPELLRRMQQELIRYQIKVKIRM